MAKILSRVCPWCGEAVDEADPATTETIGSDPEPGCVAICAYCAGISMYTDDLMLRPMNEEEEDEVPFIPMIRQARNTVIDHLRWGHG